MTPAIEMFLGCLLVSLGVGLLRGLDKRGASGMTSDEQEKAVARVDPGALTEDQIKRADEIFERAKANPVTIGPMNRPPGPPNPPRPAVRREWG